MNNPWEQNDGGLYGVDGLSRAQDTEVDQSRVGMGQDRAKTDRVRGAEAEREAGILALGSAVNQTKQMRKVGQIAGQMSPGVASVVWRGQSAAEQGQSSAWQKRQPAWRKRPATEQERFVRRVETGPGVDSVMELRGSLGAQEEREARAELTRDEAQIENPLAYVGEASDLQIEERKKDDYQDLLDEEGKGKIGFVNKIVRESQSSIAEKAAREVNALLRQKSFRVRDLQNILQQEGEEMALTIGRRPGDRN